MYFTHLTELLPISDTIYCVANLAVVPLYIYYVCQVTEQHPRFRLLPVVPALLGGLAVGLLYVAMTKEETNDFINIYLYHIRHGQLQGLAYVQVVVHQALRVLFVLTLLPIAYLSWKKAKDYNNHVRAFFADSDDKVFVIPYSLASLFIIATVSSIICGILGRMFFIHSITLLAIPSFSFCCMLFLIGYKGFTRQFSCAEFNEKIELLKKKEEQDLHVNQQHTVNEEREMTECEEHAPSLEGRDDAHFSELSKNINELMYGQRIYLNHNLTINDLAVRLGTSEMVNRLRIEYAVERLETDPTPSMFLLADEAGFASVTSFYRNFKLFKGCTPKQWLQRHKQR